MNWLDKNVEEKNRSVFEKAMASTEKYQDFFVDPASSGYELVEILGSGSHENGLELAFSPQDLDIDQEYFDAWEKSLAFNFETTLNTKNLFQDVDIADTFFATGKAGKKCGGTDPGITSWGSKSACESGVFTEGTTKKLYLGGNLGTNKPIDPAIEEFEINLADKHLEITPSDIFLHNQEVNLVEVTVRIKDVDEKIVKSDFSTEITLDFDNSDITKFFQISPAQTIPVTSGEAHFFLVPKTYEFGGKINMKATASRKNQKNLVTQDVPILLSRAGLFGYPEKSLVTVNDKEGVMVYAKVLDEKGELTTNFDGEIVEFSSDGGEFSGNIKTSEVVEGQAKIKFLPGKKAGIFNISVRNANKKIAPTDIPMELVPDIPAISYLTKKSKYLVASGTPVPVTAKLLDQYGNTVTDAFYQWTWQAENLEISQEKELDLDPREKGLQVFPDTEGESTIFIQPKDGETSARLSVSNSFWSNGENGRSMELTIIQDPLLKVELDKSVTLAGKNESFTATVKAETKEGELINDDFVAQIVVNPIKNGEFPAKVSLKNGTGTFKFTPGALAGSYSLFVTIPGFQSPPATFSVEANEPQKIELSRMGDDRYAAEFDLDKPFSLGVRILDKYKNVVQRFTGKVKLTATSSTRHLVDIKESTQSFSNGKGEIKVYPKGLSGTVRFIAEGENLVEDVLEMRLADFFRTTDVQNLTPESLMTLILGFEAGDMRDRENFANQFLLAGKTQAVGTLMTNPDPYFQYANIAPNGNINGETELRFTFGDRPGFLMESDFDILTEAKTFFARPPKPFFNVSVTDPGVYLFPEIGVVESVFFKNKTLLYETTPLLKIEKNGGIIPLEESVELVPTENIYQWNVVYLGDIVAKIYFKLEENRVIANVSNYFQAPKNFSGTQIRAVAPEVFFDRVFTGQDTQKPQGIGVFDRTKTEERNRKLGSLNLSAEKVAIQDDIGWEFSWKPGTLFGAKNAIGRSTQWGASDAFVLLGDPTLKIKTENQKIGNGLTQDVGQALWQSPGGSIQQIISSDVNGDGALDILSLVENQLYVQYQTDQKRANFRDAGPILEFFNGVKKLVPLTVNSDKNKTQAHLLQLDYEGNLTFWENKNGVFAPKKVALDTEAIIENIFPARLNSDPFSDVVLVDQNHTIWAIYSTGTALSSPVQIQDLSPEFVPTNEFFAYGKTPFAPINLKFSLFSYKGMGNDELVSRTAWNQFTRPDSPGVIATTPEEIAQAITDMYENPEKLSDFQTIFVDSENASFLSQIQFTAKMKNQNKNKVDAGDIVRFTLEVYPQKDLENFAFIPSIDNQMEFVRGSLKCQNCPRDPEIVEYGTGNGIFWAQVFGTVKTKTPLVFTWEQKVADMQDITLFTGDFENGFDDLDDIVLPWEKDEKQHLLKFLSSKKTGKKDSLTESPYAETPIFEEVPELKSTNDLIVDLPEEDLKEKFETTMGTKSDTDGDLLPFPFDHYPTVSNEEGDKLLFLSGKLEALLPQAESVSFFSNFGNRLFEAIMPVGNAFVLPKIGMSTIKSIGGVFGQIKSAVMKNLNLASRGLARPFAMGGGNCFNQTESEAGACPSGLINGRQRPDTFPCGASSAPAAYGKKAKEYPGKPIIRIPCIIRVYLCGTSTGKTIHAVCNKCQPFYKDKCANPKKDFKAWMKEQNCRVTTTPSEPFMKICKTPPEGTQPKVAHVASVSSTMVTGSFLSVIGKAVGKANAVLKPGKVNFAAPLKSTDKTADQLTKQLEAFNRNIPESLSRSTGSGFTPNPDFLTQTLPNPTSAGGGMMQNFNNLASDVLNPQNKPVPITIPSMGQEEVNEYKTKFEENRKKLSKRLDTNIPIFTRDFKLRLDQVIRGLKYIQEIGQREIVFSEFSEMDPKIKKYEADFVRFSGELKVFCDKNPEAEDCKNLKILAVESGKELVAMKNFLSADYLKLKTQWESAQVSIKAVYPKLPELIRKLEAYAASLQVLLDARAKVQKYITKHQTNFQGLNQMAGSGAKQVIDLFDTSSKVVSAATQIAQNYAQYHEGFLAEKQKRENQWKAMQSTNKATLGAMQTLPKIFSKFSDRCRTHNADRGTLFTHLTNEVFVKNASQPVMELPENPSISDDGRFMSPAKIDFSIPVPEIRQVDIGTPDMMDSLPEIPDYAGVVEKGSKDIPLSSALESQVKSYVDQAELWAKINEHLSKYSQFFPQIDVQGKVIGGSEKITGLSGIKLPKKLNLSALEKIQVENIPDPLAAPEIEIPIIKTIPQMPKPNFQIDLPSLPMAQFPQLPSPPKMPNLLPQLMENFKTPLSFLNEECKIRLSSSKVPEWYVKPQGERMTTRAALSSKKDFFAHTLKTMPFNDVAPFLQNMGITGRDGMFGGIGEKVSQAAGMFQKALQTITATKEAIESGKTPFSLPWNFGQELQTLAPASKEFLAWYDRYTQKPTETISPEEFVEQAKKMASKVGTYTKEQSEFKAQLNALKLPTPQKNMGERKAEQAKFNRAIAQLQHLNRQLQKEKETLQLVYEKDPQNFFRDKLVQNILSKPNRYFASAIKSIKQPNVNSNFYQPLNAYKALQSYLTDFLDKGSVDATSKVIESFGGSGGGGASDGEGIANTQGKVDLEELFTPGIYYAEKETDIPMRINRIPQMSDIVIALADLDGDGNEEILYALDNQLFVKRKVELRNTPLGFTQETWDSGQFKTPFAPAVSFASSSGENLISLEFEPLGSETRYFEWELTERPDFVFEAFKTGDEKIAQWKRTVGILALPEQKPGEKGKIFARITKIKGHPQIKSPAQVKIRQMDSADCKNPEKTKPTVISGNILAPFGPVSLQAEFPVSWKKRGGFEHIELEKGESIYLESTDICVYDGEAWFSDPETDEFFGWSALETFMPLIFGAEVKLSLGDEITISFYDGTETKISGEGVYTFNSAKIDSRGNLEAVLENIDISQVYGFFSGFQNNQRSFRQPQFLPITFND